MNPMLASTVKDPKTLKFPLLASPKLDGVRAIIKGGEVLSRSLKPIPNKMIQRLLGRLDLEGLDGELVVGNPTDPGAFNRTSSGVMSVDGSPSFNFWVFDLQDTSVFQHRLGASQARIADAKLDLLVPVPHTAVRSVAELDAFEASVLRDGYEGVMLRDLNGPYKNGRSTPGEGWLMKLKRFDDSEAVVIGAAELMQNTNEARRNELGYLDRSSHKAGMVGRGMLGSLQVRGLNGPYKDVVFNIGTGFDEALRYELWLLFTIGKLTDRVVKYKYFASGAKDAPRFPVFVGFRPQVDLDVRFNRAY
jgi:DNA ligase 1